MARACSSHAVALIVVNTEALTMAAGATAAAIAVSARLSDAH
jgi:hypothetical protein